MDLENVLDRFQDKQFVLYGGDRQFLERVKAKANVVVWFTEHSDEQSIPPQNEYGNLLSFVVDAVYLMVGHGYAASLKAELVTPIIFGAPSNRTKIIIWHGYPEFIVGQENGQTLSKTSKEVYEGGCIVVPEDDHVGYLQEASRALGIEISIPVPLDPSSILPNGPLYPQVQELLPYIHLVSRLKALGHAPPTVTEMPHDRLDFNRMGRQAYDPSAMTSAIGWGQRKLLISEIELMVEAIHHDISMGSHGRDFILVYVGAAPGSHIPHLLSLFAARYNPIIHLWDRESRFDKIAGPTIRIIPDEFKDPNAPEPGFFTDVVAQKYRDAYKAPNRIILISDIRDKASEEAVMDDMALQRHWVDIIQPYACHLKFRMPYTGIPTMDYIDGTIFTQAWSRVKSSETRLLAFRPYKNKAYDVQAYDETMANLNVVTRMQSYDMGRVAENTYRAYGAGDAPPMPAIGPWIPAIADGLCTCHDCAREVQVISKYLGLSRSSLSQQMIISFVKANTIASRPRDDKTNIRTLWYNVPPRVPPSDRRIVLVYKDIPEDRSALSDQWSKDWISYLQAHGRLEQDTNEIKISATDLANVIIPNAATIVMYADGLSKDQIFGYLLAKPLQLPAIVSGTQRNALEIMRSVLQGNEYVTLVDFHSDFMPNYKKEMDRSIAGTNQFDRFLLSYEISKRQKLTRVSLHGHLILQILANRKGFQLLA